MRKMRAILSLVLVSSMILGMTACEETANSGSSAVTVAPAPSTGANTTTDPDANAATDEEIKELDTGEYVPSGNAGTVKYFGYYDITVDQKGKQQVDVFET